MSLPFLFRHPLSRTTLPISPRLATISGSSRSFASPPPPNAANAPPLPHLASSKADIPEGLSGAAPATILPSTGAVAGAAETKGLGETVEKKGRMKWLLLTGLLGFTAANYYFFLASGGAHDMRYEAEGRAKAAADKARESAAKGKALGGDGVSHLKKNVKELKEKADQAMGSPA